MVGRIVSQLIARHLGSLVRSFICGIVWSAYGTTLRKFIHHRNAACWAGEIKDLLQNMMIIPDIRSPVMAAFTVAPWFWDGSNMNHRSWNFGQGWFTFKYRINFDADTMEELKEEYDGWESDQQTHLTIRFSMAWRSRIHAGRDEVCNIHSMANYLRDETDKDAANRSTKNKTSIIWKRDEDKVKILCFAGDRRATGWQYDAKCWMNMNRKKYRFKR